MGIYYDLVLQVIKDLLQTCINKAIHSKRNCKLRLLGMHNSTYGRIICIVFHPWAGMALVSVFGI